MPARWRAQWIDPELPHEKDERQPASVLRRRFTLDSTADAVLILTNNGNVDYTGVTVLDDVYGGVIADALTLPSGGAPVEVSHTYPLRGEGDYRWRVTGLSGAGEAVDLRTETLTLSAWVDGVWGCKRRFKARYGDEPNHRFLDVAFCTSTAGLQLSWRIARNWCVYARVRQFDTLSRQARRAEKRKSEYWARRDIAIGTIGVAYEF
jgi:hypothetical protein